MSETEWVGLFVARMLRLCESQGRADAIKQAMRPIPAALFGMDPLVAAGQVVARLRGDDKPLPVCPPPRVRTARDFVLIVEEVEDTADTLAEAIQMVTRFDALIAPDGRSAMAMALAQRPHAVIFEVGFSLRQCLQAAASIRTHYAGHCPMLIAHADPRQADLLADCEGFDRMLSNPLQLRCLRALLTSAA